MIEFKNVNKEYTHKGKTINALSNINLTIEAGEVFGVVGQSGAGKSTLIRCANFLETPTSGDVLVAGENLQNLSAKQLREKRHQIGMIFQHFNLLSARTVFENIALPLELTGAGKDKIKNRVNELLELTGLSDKDKHYPAQLSGGQKQRVAIARALATQPKVLLCDEATSALDPETTDSILQLLKTINQQLGITILLITHEMEVVKKICHKVALIQGGFLVEHTSIDRFFTAPQSDAGKQFVAQALSLKIPEYIQAKLKPKPSKGENPLIKVLYHGEKTYTPLISHLSRDFSVDINIVEAHVEQIRHTTLGALLIEIIGEQSATEKAVNYLQTQANIEVIGYV